MTMFFKQNNKRLPAKESTQVTLLLRQTSLWSKAVLWTLMGVTSFGIGWATVAKIEQTVPATGQLKPEAAVKEVQTAVGGVVTQVHVRNGDRVEPGDLLLTFDSTATSARQKSLASERDSLLQENQFYQMLLSNEPGVTVSSNIPAEIAQLGRQRAVLVSENQLFQAQLSGGLAGNLTAEQLARLNALATQTESRARVAELEVDQLARQLDQNGVRLADARKRLATEQRNLIDIKRRNQSALTSAQQSLATEAKILSRLQPLIDQGAIALIQYDKQQQAVNNLKAELAQTESTVSLDANAQLQVVKSLEAEVEQLVQEQRRLQLEGDQSREELKNTTAVDETNLRGQIAANEKQIGEIDSQLTKRIVDNKKRLAQIEGETSQLQRSFEYQQVRADQAGVIFDLQATKPGFVANTSQTLLKIIPNDALVAEVFITNRDIGFVKEGMPVDVRIDSFNFSEFGDIKGEIVSVGKDALEPDEVNPFFRFPATIRLEAQSLSVDGRELSLQSGMSISANIRVKEGRRVISLIAESLVEKLDGLKSVE